MYYPQCRDDSLAESRVARRFAAYGSRGGRITGKAAMTNRRTGYTAHIAISTLVALLAIACGNDGRNGNPSTAAVGATSCSQGLQTAAAPYQIARLAVPDTEWQLALESLRATILASEDHDAPAALVHALRLDGANANLNMLDGDTHRIVDLLRDSKLQQRRYGSSFIRITRHGARYIWPTRIYAHKTFLRESHFDQIVAALAESGVPLNAEIWTETGNGLVSDLLRDTLANFEPTRREIEWTTIAIALYLPPQTEWTDRFNRRHDMNALAEVVTHAEFEGRSCGGTHMWYAMITLLRAHLARPFLSPCAAQALHARVQALHNAVLATQMPQGTWSNSWATIPSDATAASLLITSHVAECLLYLPKPMQSPTTHQALSRASTWLWEQLQSHTYKGGMIPQQHICPLTHAACVIRQLRG